jgi:hypothetical protein
MPGSMFYNRSCYYFSHNKEKLTWLHAEKFCRLLPLNASMLVVKENQELEFIKQAVIKLKQNENYQEQLVYYIGFNYTMGKINDSIRLARFLLTSGFQGSGNG